MSELRTKVDAQKAILCLRMMKKRANDMRPVLWKSKQWLRLANEENFRRSGLPSGGWLPLDREYKNWKRIHNPRAPQMVMTGRLFTSLTTLAGYPNRIDLMDAVFGTKVEYAKFHQYGTSRMPKRKIVYEPVGFAHRLGQVAAVYVCHGNTAAVREALP
jgi:phage gpG-like protein